MQYKKDGVVRDEFFPQDLAGDEAGQKQASQLVKSIRLGQALKKTGILTDAQSKELVGFYNNKPMSNEEPIPLGELFKVVPLDLTEEEKVVFVELRKRLLGF
jgi:hypothetical protein